MANFNMQKLFPSFVVIDYITPYGQHKQTVPTRQWTGAGLGDPGTFLAWDESSIAGDLMCQELIEAKLDNLFDTTTVVSYTIYNMPTPLSIPQPVYTAEVGDAGTLLLPTGQAKAVQWNMSIRSTNFGIFKWVELDRPCANVWGNVTTMDGPAQALYDVLSDPTNAWAARDNGKPQGFMGISISLNKRLRRKYDMV